MNSLLPQLGLALIVVSGICGGALFGAGLACVPKLKSAIVVGIIFMICTVAQALWLYSQLMDP